VLAIKDAKFGKWAVSHIGPTLDSDDRLRMEKSVMCQYLKTAVKFYKEIANAARPAEESR
jgi:hypothetical protein